MQKKIRIILSLCLTCFMMVPFMGCSDNNKNETESNTSAVSPAVNEDSKVLVAYFSWSGNTNQLAEMIQGETGGNIFRIVPETPYAENFEDCATRAQDELNDGTRPPLSSHIEKEVMAEYDVILLGFPIWWYDLPMPVWTFLEEYDLSGKTIIPFFTHNGSSDGAGSLESIEKLCPKSVVKSNDALSVSGREVGNAQTQMKEWLTKLGY